MEAPKYNSAEYKRIASNKYYETHKEQKKQSCYKTRFRKEFGNDFVDNVYKECDNNMEEICTVFKLKRKLIALHNNVCEKHRKLINGSN